MNEHKPTDPHDDIPASLQRGNQEPYKAIHLRIPLSWWEELRSFSREFDRDMSVFLREAIEDWLRRARKVHQDDCSKDKGSEGSRHRLVWDPYAAAYLSVVA